MAAGCQKLKLYLLAVFSDELTEMNGNALFYLITTTPPVWNNFLHDEFVTESSYDRCLIHFSYHDWLFINDPESVKFPLVTCPPVGTAG